MLIFVYGGTQVESDRGRFDVVITAPNRGVADQHFTSHMKANGYPTPRPEAHFIRSQMLGRDGILYTNLEQRTDAHQTEGGV